MQNFENPKENVMSSGNIELTRRCPSCQLSVDMRIAVCPNDGTVLAEMPKAGTVLQGKYLFLEEIGAGGMGVIYKAKHALLDQLYAVKILPTDKFTEQSFKRFQREARAASKLSHHNLVAVHDFGISEQGYPYMVMDFVDGCTLASKLAADGLMSISQALPIFVQACEAMSYAHNHGVVHRDLKPSNVMLVKEPGAQDLRVVILDFGFARILDRAADRLTEVGDVLGTPYYMSPEQALGKQIDYRSDIYSLGCLMYETLIGAAPFKGLTVLETLHKHVVDPIPSLDNNSHGIKYPKRLDMILVKCLAKEPKNRFQSMSELKKELLASAQIDAKTMSLGREMQRKTRLAAVSAVALVILAAVVAYCLFGHGPPSNMVQHESAPVAKEKPVDGATTDSAREAPSPDAAVKAHQWDDIDQDVWVQGKALVDQAHELTEQGQAKQAQALLKHAIGQFDLVIKNNPSHPWAYFDRSKAFNALNDSPHEFADLGKAWQNRPADPQWKSYWIAENLGNYYMKRQDYKMAIQWYTTGADLKPDAEQIYYRRGQAYKALAQGTLALRDFKRQTEVCLKRNDPRLALPPLLALAAGYKEGGQKTDAEKCLKLADQLKRSATASDTVLSAPDGAASQALVERKQIEISKQILDALTAP